MLKLILTIFLSIFLLYGCVTSDLNYNITRTRYYDRHSHYLGYSIKSGNMTRYYDRHSRYLGKSLER